MKVHVVEYCNKSPTITGVILHPDTRVWVKYHGKFGFMILPSITIEVAFQLYSFHC